MGIAVYTKPCAKNVPGISKVLWTEIGNIATVTITSGEITAITMDTGKKFHEHNCEIDSVELKMEGESSTVSFQTNSVEMGFAKLSKELITMKTALTDGAACGLASVAKDGNGSWFLIGYNDTEKADRPLNKIKHNFTSGKKLSDTAGNMFTITVSGESGYDIVPFNTTLNTALTAESTAATAFCTFN
jgi:hypothetical protein